MQNKRKKTKARFGRLLRPLACKQNGSILKEIGQQESKYVRRKS